MSRGRPKSDKPKCRQYRLRLTLEEHNRLKQESDKTGKPVSKIIEEGIELYFKKEK